MCLLDVVSPNHSVSINTDVIKIFDINTALYMSMLLTIYSKAEKKNKLIDGSYFKLDRNYMRNVTSLSKENQLLCDVALISSGILEKSEEDILKINVDQYLSVLSGLSKDDIKVLKQKIKDDTAEFKSEKKSAKDTGILTRLCSYVTYTDIELKTSMKNWINVIVSRFGSKSVSKDLISYTEKEINNYSKGDLDVALDVLKIAITMQYKDIHWAITKHIESNKKSIHNSVVRSTEQKKTTSETVNKTLAF